MDNSERAAATRRVTLVGAGVNVLLAVGKTIIGFVGNSQALIADGLHSFSDLASDMLVLYAARAAHQEADQDHPYGHARFETAATVGVGLLLIGVAVALLIDAGQRLVAPESLLQPGVLALGAAAFSILANECLYRYTVRVANRFASNLLRANAWHHRSDAVSSVVVVAGVGGTMMGYPYLDAFAAVGVAMMIARMGLQFSWRSLEELVDKGLDPDQLAEIRTAISTVQGVQNTHMLRTRRMAGQAFVDVHVQVAPRVSVSEGHHIADRVQSKLMKQVDDILDVTIHVDPEDDEHTRLNRSLPLRAEVLENLSSRLPDLIGSEQPVDMNLHYLSGRIHMELILPLSLIQTPEAAEELAEKIAAAAAQIEGVGAARVFFG